MIPPTTPAPTWHAGDDLLARYVAGTAAPSEALSIEAHVLGCRDCQAHVADAVGTPVVERTWAAVADRVDTADTWLTRALDRVGVPDADGRLVAAAARLQLPWFGAVLAVLLVTVVLASLGRDGGAEAAYLVVGPVLPLLGVAVAYGPATDPTWHLGLTAPLPHLRLLLVRSAAVLVASLPIAAAVGLLAGAGPAVPAALLPGLALAGIALALGDRVQPLTTAAALVPAWVLVIGGSLLVRPGSIGDAAADAVLYHPHLQIACALVAAGALALTLRRPAAFDLREDRP